MLRLLVALFAALKGVAYVKQLQAVANVLSITNCSMILPVSLTVGFKTVRDAPRKPLAGNV